MIFSSSGFYAECMVLIDDVNFVNVVADIAINQSIKKKV